MGKNEQRDRINEKNKNGDWRKLDGDAGVYFLGELRQARLTAQKDAEAFDQLLFVFERLGCFRLAEVATLGDYQKSLLDLAAGSALGGTLPAHLAPWHSDKAVLYTLVTQARNDALHQGAGARHLTEHAIELALLFEDALMNGAKPMTRLGDIMVRSPVTAEPWQPVSFARQVMLTNSFSTLPILVGGKWRLVTDANVAAFLRKDDPNRDERSRRLGLTLEGAGNEGLRFVEAVIENPDCPIASITQKLAEGPGDTPVLVCESPDGKTPQRLLGIVTAFDIL